MILLLGHELGSLPKFMCENNSNLGDVMTWSCPNHNNHTHCSKSVSHIYGKRLSNICFSSTIWEEQRYWAKCFDLSKKMKIKYYCWFVSFLLKKNWALLFHICICFVHFFVIRFWAMWSHIDKLSIKAVSKVDLPYLTTICGFSFSRSALIAFIS